MHPEEARLLEARIQKALKFIEQNPDAKVTTVARQFEVPRGRLRNRLNGRTSLANRPPTNTKLSSPEEVALCCYIDRLNAINLAVHREFIMEAVNLILKERSGHAKQANLSIVDMHWIDHFVKQHKYHLTT